ncbi:MAG: hypothetical protein Q7K44_05430 [Candidatus Liptonbacteria bacterium]|nr:hypothetical protein [Candidatus Liptonbacteria bacterium]
MYGTTIVVCASLTLANFSYMAFFAKRKEWKEAAKISLFQVVAVGIYAFVMACK